MNCLANASTKMIEVPSWSFIAQLSSSCRTPDTSLLNFIINGSQTSDGRHHGTSLSSDGIWRDHSHRWFEGAPIDVIHWRHSMNNSLTREGKLRRNWIKFEFQQTFHQNEWWRCLGISIWNLRQLTLIKLKCKGEIPNKNLTALLISSCSAILRSPPA